jgi:hypothetical protein
MISKTMIKMNFHNFCKKQFKKKMLKLNKLLKNHHQIIGFNSWNRIPNYKYNSHNVKYLNGVKTCTKGIRIFLNIDS